MLQKIVIEQLMKELKQNGSQAEVAIRHNVDQTMISKYISGKSMTLETFDKMFPQAVVRLYGETVAIQADRTKGNVVGVNHGSINSDGLSALQDKILESDDLTAEEKIKFLKLIKETK